VNWFGIGEYREERGVRAVNRVAAEIAHVRGHYSTAHNAAVVALLAVVYPLAIAGFARRRRRPLSLLMLAVVAGHIAIVAVTFYDYDGRYLLYVFPLIVVFASCGVSDLVQRVRRSGGPIDYRGSPSTAPN
jgi:hypothetical protein